MIITVFWEDKARPAVVGGVGQLWGNQRQRHQLGVSLVNRPEKR